MVNPDEEVQVESTDDGEFASLAFKIMTDPFVGQLTFIRVYRGSLESGPYVLNLPKEENERVGDYEVAAIQERRGALQEILRLGKALGAVGKGVTHFSNDLGILPMVRDNG